MAPMPFTQSLFPPTRSYKHAGLCDSRHLVTKPVLGSVVHKWNVTCQATSPARLEQLPVTTSIATDATVPEGHKGLHGFLYGTGGAEEHDGDDVLVSSARYGQDDGSVLMPVEEYLASRHQDKPLGVYCVYNQEGALQYIGYARNMVLSIKGHLARMGPSQCARVSTKIFANKAMASRGHLEREVQTLLEEHAARHAGVYPPGNAVESPAWSEPEGEVASVMSPAERERYETKKLKLRKAMGEDVVLPGQEREPDAAERRELMKQAVEGGDWSVEIDRQTRETIAATATESAPSTSSDNAASASNTAGSPGISDPVVSPFAKNVGAAVVDKTAGRSAVLLTIDAVNFALDEVRPYLLADGGDVEVVSVEGGVVALRLQGACGTCASSAATMKNGIEKVIKNTFGEQVRDIVQLDSHGVKPQLTVAMVDMQLNMLRGAIHNFGGVVEVASVEGGVVSLRYIGPPAIGKGVAAAVKDAFAPNVKEVRFVHD